MLEFEKQNIYHCIQFKKKTKNFKVMESIAERNSGEGPSNSKRQKMSS